MILSNYAIKFRTAVLVFVAALAVLGTNSYLALPREGMPDVTIPFVFVTAPYEGTAPAEIEKLVTIPLEKQLQDLENVKEMRSTSAENVCVVSIEFQAGQDIDLALQKAKDKVDLAAPDLPDDLDEPTVEGINFSSDFPIFTLALSGNTDPDRLKSLAEDLQDEIELVPGVRQAEISGIREREVRVEFDLTRLAAYGLPVGLVMRRIREENSTISAGNIEAGGDKFQVRIPGEFHLASEMRDILITRQDGHPVFLSDVATVADTYKDVDSISRLNGQPSVSISVKKRAQENSVTLIRRVREALGRFRLPPDLGLTVVLDESEYVDSMVKELENNILSGFILVVLVLLVFMGWRNSMLVGLAIPLSMLLTFVLLQISGHTLNMMVLFSLVLSVGMLVDNAIVIVDSIYRRRSEGLSQIDAARRGTGELAWPVITSTLTTVVAFYPLFYWPGIMGQFMSFLPWTVIASLLASLFVALVINPAVCSWVSAGAPPGRSRLERPMAAYERLLRASLRHRAAVLVLAFLTLAASLLLYGRFGRGIELFPEVEPRNAVVQIKFPQGTSLDRTDEALRQVEARLGQHEDVKFFLATIASAGGMQGFSGGGGTHIGNIHVEFKPAAERRGNTTDLVGRIREDVGAVPGAEVKVEKQKEGPPTGAPVTIEVSGDDFDVLSALAGDITRSIATVPGLVDLQDDYEEAVPELQFRVDRRRAAMLGLDTGAIGLFLRTAIYGMESSRFRAGDEEYDITLRLPQNQRDRVDVLDRAFVPVAGRSPAPLSGVGAVAYTGGRGAINRKDQNRMVTITGNNQGRGVDEILRDVRGRIGGMTLPRGYSLAYAGDTKEMRESGRFLLWAFGVAVGMIAVILVTQFNSAVLPLIILTSVAMSLVGVMWGLLICGMRFGVVMTGIGVICLAGVVVNNAIVLVDCMLQRRKEGLSTTEALVAAGRQRMRPVMLTAVTTILGLIPLAVGWSVEFHEWPPRFTAGAESSAWWAPMAVAVMFGLGVATLLTLLFVPAMCSVADSVSVRVRRRLGFRVDGE